MLFTHLTYTLNIAAYKENVVLKLYFAGQFCFLFMHSVVKQRHLEKEAFLFFFLFIPDDHSRVLLRKTNGESSDYINANYIDVILLFKLCIKLLWLVFVKLSINFVQRF